MSTLHEYSLLFFKHVGALRLKPISFTHCPPPVSISQNLKLIQLLFIIEYKEHINLISYK